MKPHTETTSDTTASTTGASILAGGAWTSVGRVIPQLYTVIVSVVAARYLGPDDFGRQSFIAFAGLSLVMMLSGGMSISLLRFVAEALGAGRAGATRSLLRWAWTIEGVAAVVGGAILVGVALSGADPEAAWLLVAVVCVVSVLQTVPSALLGGAQRWRAIAIVGVVCTSLSLPAVIAVLALGGGIVGMFAVEVAITALNLVWTTVLARRAAADIGPIPAPASDLIRRARGFALASTAEVLLTVVVWRRSEFFFLDHYSSDAQIGFYSIAFAAVTALVLIPETLGIVAAPAFATFFGAGRMDRLRSGYSRSLRVMLLVSLPLTAFAAALGPRAIEIVYGPEFEATGTVLVIMLGSLPIVTLASVSGALLAGLGRVRAVLYTGAGGVVVILVLNALLVPRYDAQGAAIANSAGQLAATIPLVIYSNRLVGEVRWEAATLVRAIVAAAAGGGAALALTTLLGGLLGGLIAATVGIALFSGLAIVLRIVPADDAVWLDTHAGHRLGGAVGALCRPFTRA